MNLYNPTEDVIENKFRGFPIVIGPGQVRSVTDECGIHLLNRKAEFGLVTVDYSEKEEELFGSITEFKKRKKIDGLKTYLVRLEKDLKQERMFPREVAQKNGGEVELSSTRVPYFEKKIKEVKMLLNSAQEDLNGKSEEVALESEKKIKVTKKRGRPPKKKG